MLSEIITVGGINGLKGLGQSEVESWVRWKIKKYWSESVIIWAHGGRDSAVIGDKT